MHSSARASRTLTISSLFALVLCLLAVSACGGGTGASSTTAGAGGVAVSLHFMDTGGRMVTRERIVAGDDPLRGALQALLAGPGEPDLLPAAPDGTRLLGTRVVDGVVRVDLSEAYESGYPSGGAAAELAVVAPLVHTAAEAGHAEAVLITVDGRTPTPVGSQIDFSQPLTPRDFPG